jgi:hypothetical protein
MRARRAAGRDPRPVSLALPYAHALVLGLTLARDRALVYWRDYRRASRSQYWMLAVMVAFLHLLRPLPALGGRDQMRRGPR